MKTTYSNEVIIRNGKIRKFIAVETKDASETQLKFMDLLKGLEKAWLRSKMEQNPALENSDILLRTKYTETLNRQTVDFKVQSVTYVVM